MKKALISGVSGQDGAYLAQLLLNKGYEVCGTSRDAQMSKFTNLHRLGIFEQVKLESMALNDFRSVLQVLTKIQPDEVYNLAGQSSVGLSFQQPVEALESIATGTLNLLEAIRFMKVPIKSYHASSGECFGNTNGLPADENTPFRPKSPYGVAKATAFWQVANYREAYNLYTCSGILFNHESPLRPERFVTQKIVSAACRIANGSKEKLYLGNVDVIRDWGWAPEYVETMYLMLQQDEPTDYVIATGESYSLADFVAQAFECVGLNSQDHVVTDESLYRPTDIAWGGGNPKLAEEKLGWRARYKMSDVVRMMVEDKLATATSEN
ncbi:MAG: GDP-mannose 4,6-dehydratase [Okeania sp. SIO3I5]|uniref:GDP-mannose 4,6-dehydratase n=1 Tax=Okeania sp. SIO3I5 TaxID=2607805 RepID=UPI0013BBCE06|nr:GDP-mannose 4,6-dehydratase [Okeania sp. SIO3I5]NEQ40728.1 GDP-mannose 4,6-dehydratase [Okeania sp. SIO3I5]